MKLLSLLLAVSTFAACAHLPQPGSENRERLALWDQAHTALGATDFETAERIFTILARDHRESREGVESLFYLGAIRMDPRNPAWDPQPAESRLRAYLERDTLERSAVHRRPEAVTLLQLAQQLNLPPDERVAGLQPEPRVVRTQERVVVPARQSRELAAEVARLRQEVATRDEQIRSQREELERIRKTLVPR